jgi:hypothetical protein
MLWFTMSMFFSNLKTFLGKWTFINVHFLKKSFKSGKTMHIAYIGVRPPNLCGVTFMLWLGRCGSGHVATIMLRMPEFVIYDYKIYIMGYKWWYMFYNKQSTSFHEHLLNRHSKRNPKDILRSRGLYICTFINPINATCGRFGRNRLIRGWEYKYTENNRNNMTN